MAISKTPLPIPWNGFASLGIPPNWMSHNSVFAHILEMRECFFWCFVDILGRLLKNSKTPLPLGAARNRLSVLTATYRAATKGSGTTYAFFSVLLEAAMTKVQKSTIHPLRPYFSSIIIALPVPCSRSSVCVRSRLLKRTSKALYSFNFFAPSGVVEVRAVSSR